jgi:short-subunit dehydrogenase
MSAHSTAGVALVSGANRGIGREVGRQLAERGYAVLLGARDEAKGRAAAEEIGR